MLERPRTPLWFLTLLLLLIFIPLVIYVAPKTQPYIYPRLISTFIISFLLPGFSLIQMLFSEGVLNHVERIALSIGASLALTPIVTLILNYTPYAVNRDTLLASLTLLTMIFTAGVIAKLKSGHYTANPTQRINFSLINALQTMLPLTIALCLRVYPFLLSGLPFSVDAWPSIKYAEVLLKNSPISLNSEWLKGCDELGDRVFGATVSALAGLQPITAMAFYIPIAGAMTVLILYALVKNFYGSTTAFIASILLATAVPDVILTAGVKGETYAHPLYMTLILLFLHKEMDFWKRVLLFSIVSISLALTHYYTAILITTVLASMGMAELISRWRAGEDFEVNVLIFPLILALTVFTYLTVYASWAFKFISSVDWLSATSYQLVFFALALYFTLKPQNVSRVKTVTFSTIASLIVLLLVLFATKRPLVPGAPILPIRYLLYAGPFLIATPLAVLGYKRSKSLNNNGKHVAPPLFWLTVVLGLECYAVFGNIETGLGLTLAYRGLVFLIPPLSILCATALAGLLEDKVTRTWSFSRVSAAVILIVISTLNLYAFYATIFMQERYMGYFWLYRIQEYKAGSWISNVCDNKTIACDVKTTYLLRYYFGLKVDEFQGFLYLLGKSSSKPEILLIYGQMLKNGYVVYGGYSVDLPENWMEKASHLNLIYSNGFVTIYAK